jgi:hypothetical protein
MAIMVLVLTTNLIPDLQRSEGEKLVTWPTLSQCPLMIAHTKKARRENPHHLARITQHMADTIRMKLLPAIRPICHHQSIRHSGSLREELSCVKTKARGDESMMLAAEMSHHDGKLAVMADPGKGNKLDMMTARNAAATKTKIVQHTAAMTKGKAPASMTRTRKIQLHVEQREAIAVAEIYRRMPRAKKGVTPPHPHQAAPMVAAVAVRPGPATLEKICNMKRPTTHAPT